MPDTVSVPSRFNGPLDSGNGGYSAGIVAGFLEGTAEVSLRSPVPLDTALDVIRGEDGSVRLLAGEDLVAEGRSVELDIEVPDPVSVEDAREASSGYRGLTDGPFSSCFVCGKNREDAFGVFAGAVEGRKVVASPWTPPASTADDSGAVRPEFVWSVLDCPTYFATYIDEELPEEELPLSVLARLTAGMQAPVTAGAEHVVMAWPIDVDGRKRHAGAAVLSAEGEVLAVAKALLIELKQPPP